MQSNNDNGPRGTRRLVAPELLSVLDNIPSLTYSDEMLPLVRAGIDQRVLPPLPAELKAVECEQRFVPGPAGAPDVRVLIYRPPGKAASPRPAYLHMHGGGYVIGKPEMSDGLNRWTAAQVGCVIVSVDYRLAPETRFPGAVEDCYAALIWLHTHADQLGVDRNRIAIGGESAGGGHAAALAIYARGRGEVPICFQSLDSPMLDDRTGSVSEPHPFCGEFVWLPASNRFGWRSLLGMEPGGPNIPSEAVPARVADLSSLPPACIVVGALDLFLEEDLEYGRRLARAGVPTEIHVIPGAFHGFASGGGDIPQIRTCRELRRDALARAFAL